MTLSGAEAHHAVAVLRVRTGEPITVLDGCGREFHGQVGHVGKHSVTLEISDRRERPVRSCEVHLAVALLKGRAWDAVLEKATELGAASIQPLSVDRCVARVTAEDVTSKIAGWRATTIAAAKQCGTPWLPTLSAPQRLEAWIQSGRQEGRTTERRLVASLESEAVTIRSALSGGPHRRITVVIGPEGDFTPAEYGQLHSAGVVAVTLGSLILRADTAVIAALAVCAAELREMG